MDNIKFDGRQITSTGQSVIGIYFPNGTFSETPENQGISYILDQVLYEMLEEVIGDYGYGQVFGHSYHGYSSFIITCSHRIVDDILNRVREVLYEHPLKETDIVSWIAWRRKIMIKKPVSVENQYYAKCLCNSPLAKSLSAALGHVPDLDSIRKWRENFIKPEYVITYITNDNDIYELINSNYMLSGSVLPMFSSQIINLPKHIPWPRTNMVYSIPYSLTNTNVIASEAYCYLLRGKIASSLNSIGVQLFSALFCPDYLPELRVYAQMSRGVECDAVRTMNHIISSRSNFTPRQLNTVKNQLFRFYHRLSSDPVAWNRFAGYNAISGKRYSLDDLCNINTYDEKITLQSLLDVEDKVRVETQKNVFAASVR